MRLSLSLNLSDGGNMRHVKCYRKGYPRPQFVKNNFRDLCGEWSFRFDDENEGESLKWYNGFPESKKIRVPFSYQTAASGIKETENHDVLWYWREIEYDKKDFCSKRLLLHFEGCDYFAKVWVNGKYVGCHRGGYCRFTFDITEEVRACGGRAEIAVRAEDTLEAVQPRGKQSPTGSPVGCWYHNTSGLWKAVWTEFVPEHYLESVKITPSFHEYYTEFEAVLHTYATGLALRIIVSYGEEVVSDTTSAFTGRILSVKTDLNGAGELFRVRYWTPVDPRLYDVEFILLEDGKETERAGSYFGLAEFRAEGNCLALNCNPVYIKMVLLQGYHRESGLTAPDEEAFVKDIMLAKELGFNGIRMHQKIEDERFYYYADILGMAVWCEMPSAYEYRSETIDKVAAEWLEAVRQNYNHPSIVAWVPLNESWGVPRILSDPGEQAFSRALYYSTKAYDTRRPVISNDGWEHTESDIVTLHNYAQTGEALYRFYGDLEGMLAGKNVTDYTQTRLPYARGFAYRGEPVVVSEFAGIGYQNGREEGWGYGSKVSSSAEFAARLKELVGALRKIDGISGFCVTQLTDVESEINGLFDLDRRPKAPLEDLKAALEG